MLGKRVLEVNVDDLNTGGVFSMMKNVIEHKPGNLFMDIAAIERFSNEENIHHFNNLGSNVFYVGYDGNKFIKQFVCFMKLLRIIKKNGYDFVHIHADVANKLLVSALAAKAGGAKHIVLHSHAAGVDGNHRILKNAVHKLCRKALPMIGTDFVACSDFAAAWMYPAISKEHITIIHNGVDLQKFKFDKRIRARIRKELSMVDELVIGHVGRFAYQKNHPYIIQIAKELKRQKCKCKILLVGEGPDEDMIIKLAKSEAVDDFIIFYGTSKKINELFMAMDVFILPSHFEGLPVVGVEAQASGLPTVFADTITRHAQLIQPSSFVGISDRDIAEWLHKITADYSNYSRETAYLEVERRGYSIENTVNEFVKIYQEGK